MRNLTAALFLCCASSLSATIFHEIDTTKPLECTLSWRHHNRVAVNCGRVKKVICPEGFLSLRLEQESGQLFLGATSDRAPEVTLSVITDAGYVQDLQIAFSDKPSEVVILSEPTDCEEENVCQTEEEKEIAEISNYVHMVLAGRTPPGSVLCHIRSKPWKFGNGLTAQPTVRIEGPIYDLFLFKVKNGTSSPRNLEENQVAQPGCKWVYLDKHCLNSKEEALAIVAFKKL